MVLFPVAVLIVLGLGGLALDSATIFLGQRRLADLAAALATDAVAAIDHDSLFAAGQPLGLSPDRVADRRAQLVAAQAQDRGFDAIECDVAVDADPPRAVATCTAEVRPLFAPLLPGMGRVERVHVVETAIGSQR